MELSKEFVRSVLHYCPETGVFTWRLRNPDCRENKHFNAIWGGTKAGSPITMRSGGKYWQVSLGGKQLLAHRLAFIYMEGWAPDEIDHVDRRGDNNSWRNLRPATRAENMLNKSLYKNSSSGVAGVNWHKKQQKWAARAVINGIRKTIGSFETLDEAERAVKRARSEAGYSPGHGLPAKR